MVAPFDQPRNILHCMSLCQRQSLISNTSNCCCCYGSIILSVLLFLVSFCCIYFCSPVEFVYWGVMKRLLFVRCFPKLCAPSFFCKSKVILGTISKKGKKYTILAQVDVTGHCIEHIYCLFFDHRSWAADLEWMFIYLGYADRNVTEQIQSVLWICSMIRCSGMKYV